MSTDAAYMRMALGLASRGVGLVAPNPAVGCVLTKDAVVIGRGWTQPGGRPHAETEALARAGDAAQGSTAYVTLEPCAHVGKTPPCTDALIKAGIRRCVVALLDPDPRVSGAGLVRLRDAGIAVEQGLLAQEAAALNAGFLSRINHARPLVTLKLATSLDGRIATSSGESKWITGAAARRRGHLLRYRHDAVLVGSGTVLADDPALDVRIAGLDAAPKPRIILDSRLRTPLTAQIVETSAEVPTIILTLAGGDAAKRALLAERGVELVDVDADAHSRVSLEESLRLLAMRGLTRVLVEGGATLATALLRQKLVDRLAWFHSVGLIGGDGLPAIKALGVDHLAEILKATRIYGGPVGEDFLDEYILTEAGS